MEILAINHLNFRNLTDGHLEFASKYNIFLGKNGQGKTSILEAIYFVITGKSFRTNKNQELIRYNQLKTGAYVDYQDKIGKKSLSVKQGLRKKEYSYNKKKVSYEDFHGKLLAVSFIPEDIHLITGNPSLRRSFFDYEISQANKLYYTELKKYNKLLKVRNKYIKEKKTKEAIYKIYEEEFISSCAKLIKARLIYIKNISILLTLNYRKLFDATNELNLSYSCFLGKVDHKIELEELEEKLKAKIVEVKHRENHLGYSLVGPQKDDFIFYLNGQEAKAYSSQGEKKSIVFSLKLAEVDMIIKERQETPIFIIDDISSYFDSLRKEGILKHFQKRDIQLFISSTTDLDIEGERFVVEEGVVKNAGKGNSRGE